MSEYYAKARQYAQANGLPPELGEALAWQESRGNPKAVSPAGARGLIQIMPATAQGYGVHPDDLFDPDVNLGLGMKILAKNVRNYGLENGLAAYNAGEGRLRKSGFNLAAMPSETQGYVPSVLGRAAVLGGSEVADYRPVLKNTLAQMGGGEMYLGQPMGHFRSQNVGEKNPEAMAAINDFKDTQRAMLPLALANMMSSNRGQQNFGNRLYAEAVQGINPMKMANGFVMDDGTYITDQDPSAMYRAQAALLGEMNDANNAGTLGGGSVTQIGLGANGEPIFKGKSPTPFVYNEQGQAIPYTGGVGAKSGSNPTEDQSKAAGWYEQGLRALKNANKAIENDGSANRQGGLEYAATFIPGKIGDAAVRASQGDNRQAFVDAASSFAEAALRAATGAGINESEAKQKIAELIPNYNDKPEAIKNKMAQWPGYLEQFRVRAGRALNQGSGQTPGVGAGAPGGNAADPLGILGGR